MHEIGHNLGFGHSGLEGALTANELEYGDKVGVMGSSSGKDQDRMCFNPHKNFYLPWYTDQNNSIDPLDGDGTHDLLLHGVADYGDDPLAIISLKLQTPSSQSKDYFVGFNRKSGVNADTKNDPNLVTVVRAEKDSMGKSRKVASLPPGSAYEIKDFDGNGSTVTVLFLALADGKDATVRIFDGPLPPPNEPDDCLTKLSVLINVDKYPEDVSWSVIDASTGLAVGSGGNYPHGSDEYRYISYEESVCIPKSSIEKTYNFIVVDNYGDGLCCQQGYGPDKTFRPGYKVTDAFDGTVYVDRLGLDQEYNTLTHPIEIAGAPTEAPTEAPTQDPTKNPTKEPTQAPTVAPTKAPTEAPTQDPTKNPTKEPTRAPTVAPTKDPTEAPTKGLGNGVPTDAPTTTESVNCTPTPNVCFKGCNGNKPKGCHWVGKKPGKPWTKGGKGNRCRRKAKNMGEPKLRAEYFCPNECLPECNL